VDRKRPPEGVCVWRRERECVWVCVRMKEGGRRGGRGRESEIKRTRETETIREHFA